MNYTLSVKTETAEMTVFGIFLYRDLPADESALSAFLEDFGQKGGACFSDCGGAYRARIDYADGHSVYFADNSGFLRYYISRDTGGFHTTMAEAAPARENRRPNYPAIAEFLYYGCIYSSETTVSSVYRSDPECYYIVRDGNVEKKSKDLPALESVGSPRDMLERQMARFVSAAKERGPIGCTISGGTDSRAVLAHVLHQGVRPALAVTEGTDAEDVRAAREIAKILDLPLTVVDAEEKEPGWIDAAIRASDGMMGVCGPYRLCRMSETLRAQGLFVQCGGLAGELYKNSFLNQDYPFYGGRPRWERFLHYKVATYDFPLAICGEHLRGEMEQVPARTLAQLKRHSGKNKANAYLDAGFRIMQYRSAALSGAEARSVLYYNPLLERNVAALSFGLDPYSLEMQAYQREQVTRFAPEIKDVRTDRGLTCDSEKKSKELVQGTAYLVRVASGRVFGRKKAAAPKDPHFAQGLTSAQFYTAIARCKDLGLLAPDVGADKLSQTIADRFFALGAFL